MNTQCWSGGPLFRDSDGIGCLVYGGDYNPEQWPEDVWLQDVELMKLAGVNFVTVGVFSWSKLQSGPGDFNFGWLDRILDLLHNAGIMVDLATATASPPAWLVEAHPEILPTTEYGTKLSFGSRQHYCPSSPQYRTAAAELAAAVANRYHNHPALRLWHIGNEYGCHVSACYCEISALSFRSWLRKRYGTLDAVNSAWGTDFWGQRYTSWAQINPPRSTPTFSNPSLRLDFARFSSDELLDCLLIERAEIRRVDEYVPITTNFMGLFRPIDAFKWSEALDVASYDSYPDPADDEAHIVSALTSDLTRSLGGGRPWLLMEQAPSAVNWRSINVSKVPGQYRALSLQAIARGSEGALCFQWRASRSGSEKFHSAMLPHVGTESRLWNEVVTLGKEIAGLADIAGSTVSSSVGILFDWQNWWSLEMESHPSSDLRLMEVLLPIYRGLFELGVTVDFVHPGQDLSPYRLIIAPALYLISDSHAASLATYVKAGGNVLVTFFSGIVDEKDHIRLGGYPAPWTETLGLVVEEFLPIPSDATVTISGDLLGPLGGTGRLWSEEIRLKGATVLLTYLDDWRGDRPALTEHHIGDGTAWYLSTLPDRESVRIILRMACEASRVTPALEDPNGVEVVIRGRNLFLINHTKTPRRIDLGTPMLDRLGQKLVGPVVEVAPMDVMIVAADVAPGGVGAMANKTIEGPGHKVDRPATSNFTREYVK